jgi:hypothetical protein
MISCDGRDLSFISFLMNERLIMQRSSIQPHDCTKAGAFEIRPSLSSKNRVHLLICTLHALISLKSYMNPIFLKLENLNRAAFVGFCSIYLIFIKKIRSF